MRRIGAVLGVLAAGLFASGAQGDEGLEVADAWVRAVPPVSTMTACYMSIENRSDIPRLLTAAESPAFERVELHLSVQEQGMARMVEQDSLEVAPRSKLVLEPGGYHLMLMGSRGPLSPGDTVPITLVFGNDERLELSVPVRKGSGGGAHHDHHHH
jgi:copper(I)-binding protein